MKNDQQTANGSGARSYSHANAPMLHNTGPNFVRSKCGRSSN